MALKEVEKEYILNSSEHKKLNEGYEETHSLIHSIYGKFNGLCPCCKQTLKD
jgi:hypothetical protein